jgi:hypothetical protein
VRIIVFSKRLPGIGIRWMYIVLNDHPNEDLGLKNNTLRKMVRFNAAGTLGRTYSLRWKQLTLVTGPNGPTLSLEDRKRSNFCNVWFYKTACGVQSPKSQ